jgi:hypothetical protein
MILLRRAKIRSRIPFTDMVQGRFLERVMLDQIWLILFNEPDLIIRYRVELAFHKYFLLYLK